jgi:hypothetical protein
MNSAKLPKELICRNCKEPEAQVNWEVIDPNGSVHYLCDECDSEMPAEEQITRFFATYIFGYSRDEDGCWLVPGPDRNFV